MVVGVAHGPTAQVPLRVLVFAAVDIADVAFRPFLESIILLDVLEGKWVQIH